ncbi:hypothetical protein KGF54_000381 [Candida jiufengensis]|uniref:uncharacterized protein n=1 Tax=Candida jiufengensis TaxID=497108 RepID=UPI00222517AF|nr:uncharacterized protein KGF54_000381 [Candida jiufengensis]KAI5956764.1 hypothetical protein KGF54_000381 [Candida jiufengensis]
MANTESFEVETDDWITDSLPLNEEEAEIPPPIPPKEITSSIFLQQQQQQQQNSQPQLSKKLRKNENDNISKNQTNDILQKLKQSEDSSSIRSSIQLSTTFQKTPLNPLTTKEDASSVVSKDSNNGNNMNGSNNNSESENDKQPKFLKNLQEFDANNQLQKSNSNNSNTELQPSLDEVKLASPKIITYRKSKRTSSDVTFDSIGSTIPTTPPPSSKYDTRLYSDEFYKDSKYRLAIMKRNIEFHQLFKSLDLTDRLLDDFSCALSREILLQGRTYISESYICFNSNLLGWVTNLVLKFEDIIKFEKRSTAGLFPNGISIETEDGSVHTFASFLSRDQTYDLMITVWKGKTGRVNQENQPRISEDQANQALQAITENNNGQSPRIQNYIMSLDGDDDAVSKIEEEDEEEGDLSDEEEEDEEDHIDENEDVESLRNGDALTPTKTLSKIVKLKPESKYSNKGPDTHSPTTAKYTKFPQEIELIEENIQAPVGIVFNILFGTHDEFQKNFLLSHDGSEISEFVEFRPSYDDPTVLAREYTYRRSLGYSIGPKSTRCEVTETIEHLNFADYIVVTTTTQTPDVPSGSVFQVKTRYVFTWGDNNSTNLLISHYVDWKGKSWMKSVIEKSSLSGSTTIVNELIKELKDEIRRNTISDTLLKSPKKKKVKIIDEKQSKLLTPTTQNTGTTTITTEILNIQKLDILIILAIIIVFLQSLILYGIYIK